MSKSLMTTWNRSLAVTLVGFLAAGGTSPLFAATAAPAKTKAQEREPQRTPSEPQAPDDPAPEELFVREAEHAAVLPDVRADEPPALSVVGSAWVAQGPAPITGGQVEGISNSPVSGAIQTIVAHPANADIAWIGAVNGGIWKTTNATAASPTWVSAGDAFSSLAMGALERDPTDVSHNTIVGASGRYSSFSRVGGPRGVLMRTTDGGTNWSATSPATLSGKNVSGLVARGATIVVSVDTADVNSCANLGIYRSTDTGATFTRISGNGTSGLSSSSSLDLVGDPTNNAVLYTVTDNSAACNEPDVVNGIFRSADTGATWTRVSNSTMEALMADSPLNNTRIAVGQSGQVYVGIINNGRLAGLFRSSNGTTNWVQLDSPSTNEGGTSYGMQPREKPGAQGGIHFSIVADPTDANIVYLGGDRQPGNGDTGAAFPNAIGANNYSGRLFKVNASLTPGSQAVPLTHCQSAPVACGSFQSTTSNSAPHADSRRMVFDANGNILEGDDGGLYRRTVPRGTGDWFSVNGNLQVTEAHDVAYDTLSNMIITGNQDNGTSEQRTVGATSWSAVSSGDGGDVSVDDSSPTQSFRYSSFQNLGSFRMRTINASGVTIATRTAPPVVTGGGPALEPQFVTPVEINAIDPTRILFAGNNDLYESLDRGANITALAYNFSSAAMVYGGRSQGVDNAALIYALCTHLPPTRPCASNSLSNVYVRTAGTGAPVKTATNPGTNTLRDIAVDPADWRNAYVINSIGEVYSTSDTGATWTNITGNLAGGSTDLRTVLYVPGSPGAVLVGGLNGVFRMPTTSVGVWNQFGTGLTAAQVWDLDYDATDDVLVAGTMGRGVWKLTPVANLGPLPTLSISDVTVTEGNAGTTNAVFTVTMSATGAQASVNYATSDGTAIAAGTTVVSTSSAITINTIDSATPYPSTIAASGLTGTITKVTATLTGFSHTYCRDVDILLVGPAGQSVVLLSDVGAAGNQASVNLTFDDTGTVLPSAALTSGTYSPTNLNDGQGPDTHASPAPGSGYGSALSVFNGTAPNGTWSLFVTDDFAGDGGSISGGWSLAITTNGGDYAVASGTLIIPAGSTTGTITVAVNGDATSEPNETFFVNLSSPSNATIADAQGQGTINNDDATVLAPTSVVATAVSPTQIDLTWVAASGATSYRVYRSVNGTSYSQVPGSPTGTTFSDTTALASTAYLYKVRSFNGAESGDSNVDLATTVIFTDDPLVTTSTVIKAVHFTEALAAVNAVRALAGQGPVAFTAPTPGNGVTVRRQHLIDLRSGLDTARLQVSLAAISYAESIAAATTPVRATHLSEVRSGVK